MPGPKPSWKKTLYLPKAALPPRARVTDRPTYLKRCTDDVYTWQQDRQHPTKSKFTLHDGPPYANGSLHIGHALNKILKDIICRFHILEGKRPIEWIPGWDCHGLPIELKALQDLGGKPADAVTVRRSARRLAEKTIENQRKSFREWGIMADWDNAWTTMDKGFEIKQLEVFKEMVKKGLIYRRFKPVYWSPSSRTALAEAELEYRDDHVSEAAFVKYPLQEASDEVTSKLGFSIDTVSAVIWTTTPWTLPANRAIAFHGDIEYTIVESVVHGRLLLATSRISELENKCNENLKTLVSLDGWDLTGIKYFGPDFDRKLSPRLLLHANFVSEGSGSGLVHLAPGHGMDDYVLCLRHEIPAFAPVDAKGCFTELASSDDVDLLLGKDVLSIGNKAVLDHLSSRNRLLVSHKYTHDYPYDWRSKQPVIVRATEQWFADVGDIQQDALKALDSVKFVPPNSKTRLETFVKNRSEWCISRQRAWGVPIPALYNAITNKEILTEKSVSHIISTIKERGIDAWWTDDELDPVWTPPYLRNSDGQTSYSRGKDTMDVWFDSGTSWTQTEQPSKSNPHVATCYVEGTDQHRGWFQSSLLTHVAYQSSIAGNHATPKAPFETLITHGFTLDHDGRKMSKSIGNVVSPVEIMEGTLLPPMKRKINGKLIEIRDAMGPDALRLWVASCDYTTDVKVSQTVLQAINGSLSKYRVTFRLLLGILDDFYPSQCPTVYDDFDMVHKIALWQLAKVDACVREHYQLLEFNRAISKINAYINTSLSSFYFECIKDAAYCGTTEQRMRVQATIYQIFFQLQQMLLPVTPLLVEEVWDYTPTHIKDYYSTPPGRRTWTGFRLSIGQDFMDKDLEYDVSMLMRARAAVNSAQEAARNDKKMGDSLQSFVTFTIGGAQDIMENMAMNLFVRYKRDLGALFVVSNVESFVGEKESLTELSNAEWSYSSDFEIHGCQVTAHVYTPQKAKCVRCWRYHAPLEVRKEDALCARCEDVVEDLRRIKPELFEEVQDSKAADTV
ncbi:isoleucine-tRNA ligase [Mycoblastus sanguinarius]|nr:isoleucine-tRNA ligase [Mycoblastus sanguinarius]